MANVIKLSNLGALAGYAVAGIMMVSAIIIASIALSESPRKVAESTPSTRGAKPVPSPTASPQATSPGAVKSSSQSAAEPEPTATPNPEATPEAPVTDPAPEATPTPAPAPTVVDQAQVTAAAMAEAARLGSVSDDGSTLTLRNLNPTFARVDLNPKTGVATIIALVKVNGDWVVGSSGSALPEGQARLAFPGIIDAPSETNLLYTF